MKCAGYRRKGYKSDWKDPQSVGPRRNGKHIQQSSGHTEIHRDIDRRMGWGSWRGLQQRPPPCHWRICVQLLVSKQVCRCWILKLFLKMFLLRSFRVIFQGFWISLGCQQSMTQRATADRVWLAATTACWTPRHFNRTLTITGKNASCSSRIL